MRVVDQGEFSDAFAPSPGDELYAIFLYTQGAVYDQVDRVSCVSCVNKGGSCCLDDLGHAVGDVGQQIF